MTDCIPSLLIAERDPFMRDALTRALQPEFRLEFVEDGAAALERIRRDPPSLVVLAALLPTLDGFQVCRRIKEDPATRQVRVLFLTLLAAEERAAQAGADAFLRKPARREVLLETVRRLMDQEPGPARS